MSEMGSDASVLELRGGTRSRDHLRFVGEELFGLDIHASSQHVVSLTLLPMRDRGLSRVDNRGPAMMAERSIRHISSDHRSQGVAIGVCLDGSVDVATGGAEARSKPGDLIVAHTAEPHRARIASGTRLGLLFIPDTLLRAQAGVVLSGSARLVLEPRGISAVLSRLLCSVFEELRFLAAEQSEAIERAVIQLVPAILGCDPGGEGGRIGVRLANHRRVLRFIEAHLRDPRLRPAWIAERLQFSPRYLHLLFEDSPDSVSATILARRLDSCRVALDDPLHAHRSISEIAFSFGFNDASHFSRAFRARFGISPREARRHSLGRF